MWHSSRTADTYYTSLGDDHRHVEAYQAMETLRKRQLDDSDPEEEPDPVTVPRRKGQDSEEEGEVLIKFFKDYGKVSLEDARKFLEQHPHINRTLKQVQDKLWTLH